MFPKAVIDLMGPSFLFLAKPGPIAFSN